MAAQGPLITGPPSHLAVKARQRLKTPEAAEAFNAELLSSLDGQERASFEDFDISQNPIPYDEFENIFTTLNTTGVRVERARFFGCPTLDDAVMHLLAGWLINVTAETCPFEIHLSDCAITTDGFNALMEAIDSNDAFPYTSPRNGQKAPLYLRMENNYIDEAAIQERVDAGMMIPFQKTEQLRFISPTVKVKLLVLQPGKFQQRAGTPPAPEDAPPPRHVFDKTTAEQISAKGGIRGAWPAQQGNKGNWQPQPGWQQSSMGLHAAASNIRPVQLNFPPPAARPVVVYPNAAPKGFKGFAPANGGKGSPAAQQQQQTPAAGGRQAERSRTPPPRQPAARPPPKDVLPYPWEEHFSDEYGIPYYWHPKTGESMWEKPVK